MVINRGTAVNMDCISDIEDGCCVMKDGRKLPIKVREYGNIRRKWHEYRFEKYVPKGADNDCQKLSGNGLPVFIIFPSAILCYLPMVKKLRFSLKKILLWEFGILLVLSPVMAFLCLRFGLSINTLLIPALILFYIMFRGTVTTGKMQTLAVFVGVCNLMSFPSVYSVMYDAYLHPDGLLENYSMEANIFSLVLTLILSAVIGYPLCVKGSELIEHQTSEKVWGLTIPVSLVMLMINYSIEPVYYRNMYVGRMFFLAIMIITAMLLLLMFLMVIFYYAAMSIYQNEQTKAKARMLEMQESRYLRLQDYIEKTRKLRHDFRQSIHVMNTLAAEEDYDTLKNILPSMKHRCRWGLPTIAG